MTTVEPQYPRRIVVEGKEDEHVVLSLMRQKNIPTNVNMQSINGIGNLPKAITSAILDSTIEIVGIVVDANSAPKNRWRGLCTHLRQFGYRPQANPSPGGMILQALGPVQQKRGTATRVGIWMMPDNNSPGEIEDFVAMMVPRNNLNWRDANKYVQSIPANRLQFGGKKITKVTMRAWLATSTDPNHMGSAINKGNLSTTNPLCQQFCNWLKRLLD